MTGVSLNCLYIAAVQLQLVGDAGVPEAVEDHLRKIIRFDQPGKAILDNGRLPRGSAGAADHQIVIRVFIAKGVPCQILFPFKVHQHLRHCMRKENLADTALCLRSLQNHDCHRPLIL